jgi:CRISPR/Cas system-associated exonuclease Cas4 (RecB family)
MEIEHISVSRKQLFDQCPQSYKYRYHLKTIVEGPQHPWLSYGKTIHKIAEEYVRAGGSSSIEEIATEVMEGRILIEEGVAAPPLESDYKKKFPNHLRHIKELTEKIGFDGELEYNFKYDLDPPNNRLVTGFIDRLIIRGDKYFILDYKTTKKGFWRKNNYTIRKDLQMAAYGMVVQKLFNAKAENIRAALYYLEGPELVSVRFNDEMLEKAGKELLQTHINISEMDPDDAFGRVTDNCKRCDYRKMCPYYSLT